MTDSVQILRNRSYFLFIYFLFLLYFTYNSPHPTPPIGGVHFAYNIYHEGTTALLYQYFLHEI